jgi:predicted dienelactone hydrolase
MFLFWLIGYSLVKIKIKYFSLPGNKDQFSPPEKALATLAIAVAKPEKKLRAARTTTNLRKTTENHCY